MILSSRFHRLGSIVSVTVLLASLTIGFQQQAFAEPTSASCYGNISAVTSPGNLDSTFTRRSAWYEPFDDNNQAPSTSASSLTPSASMSLNTKGDYKFHQTGYQTFRTLAYPSDHSQMFQAVINASAYRRETTSTSTATAKFDTVSP